MSDLILFYSLKPVWEAPRDLVTEMECATVTGRAEETGSAPATTVIKETSV